MAACGACCRIAERPTGDVFAHQLAQPAEARNAAIGRQLLAAASATGRRFVVVSRGDSTLRGHFPGEVAALAAALAVEFDAWLLIPFFEAGGRYTIDNVHYVAEGDWLVPAGQTAFAADRAFGYRASNLREWVAEKTGGRVRAADVGSITLDDIRRGGPEQVSRRLLGLPRGSVCVVNAASNRDLAVVTAGLLAAEAQGRRYLYRTAASFVAARAAIAPRSLLTAAELDLGDGGGVVIAGSYVPTTSGQLDMLLVQPGTFALEVSVDALLDDARQDAEIARVAGALAVQLARGADVVIYTSRRLVSGDGVESSLLIGQRVSASLVAIARTLQEQPRYVIAKGGIT